MSVTRRPRSAEEAEDSLLALMRAALAGLVLLVPLPFGAVQPWAVLFFEIWAAALGAAALWIICRRPEILTFHGRRLLLPAVLLLLLCVVQLLPLPGGLVRLIAGPTAAARDTIVSLLHQGSSTLGAISASPPDTLDALLRMTAYLSVGLAASICLRERRHLKMLCMAIVASGLFQALYGSAEYLSGQQQIFGYAKRHYLDSATGTFINRNHFASYLAMTMPLALRAYLIRHERPPHRGWRERFVHLFSPAMISKLFLAVAAFVILAGILLSYSRGGLAAALAGSLYLLLSTPRWRRKLPVLLLAFLLPAAFLSWQEIKAPGARFFADSDELVTLSSRLPLWNASADILPSYLPAGSGLGTFEKVFNATKPASLDGIWMHAHNDWLQLLMEGGLPALFLAGWMLYIILVRGEGRGVPLDRDPSLRTNAIVAGIVAIAFHSLLDFSLRIPAVAILASCLIGMGASGCIQQGWSLPSLVERRRSQRT
jgi:O-antigen ligase